MISSRFSIFLSRRKVTIAIAASALLFLGVAASAAGATKDYHRYHQICVNLKTKELTYGGDANSWSCGSTSFSVVSSSGLTAAALKGLNGVNGKDGINGIDGKDGKTLWNGIKDPETTWGAPGDMYINATTQTLFGPKNLDGSWPAGVSMVGPRGNQGLIGLTGATGSQGPQGPGGSGPTGATGATGSDASLTCAQGGTCVIGATGPGGGKVFYIQTATVAAPWRYMESAPNTWNGGESDPIIVWCSNTSAFVPNLLTGSVATQQTSDAIGAGYANTQKMLRGCTFGAANAAAAYNGGGKSD